MLTLLTYPSGFGQFSLSPFCVKAAYLLAASGQVWKRQDLFDPRKMPHSKLPVLRTPQGLIPDSTKICNWLQSNGAEFEAGLSDLQKAQSHALIRMAEDHLYFHLVMDRWGNDAVWPTIRDTYFTSVPSIMRRPVSNGLRRQVMKGLAFEGVARFSPTERADRCEQDLEAIKTHLWHGSFLMGDNPSLADYSIGPILAAMRTTPVATELSRRVENDTQLTDYIDRLESTVPLP